MATSPSPSRGAFGYHQPSYHVRPRTSNAPEINMGQDGGTSNKAAEARTSLPDTLRGPNFHLAPTRIGLEPGVLPLTDTVSNLTPHAINVHIFISLQELLSRLGSCLRGTIDAHLRNGGGDASSDFTELLGWIVRYFSEATAEIDMDEFPALF